MKNGNGSLSAPKLLETQRRRRADTETAGENELKIVVGEGQLDAAAQALKALQQQGISATLVSEGSAELNGQHLRVDAPSSGVPRPRLARGGVGPLMQRLFKSAAFQIGKTGSRFHFPTFGSATGQPLVAPDKPRSAFSQFLSEEELSVESLRDEVESIQSIEMTSDIAEWAELYEMVGHRSPYLWKWAMRGSELTTLPCVAPELRDAVRDTKVLSIIICVLLDDIADESDNEQLLTQLLHVVQEQQMPTGDFYTAEQQEYLSITLALARVYTQRIRSFPFYDSFSDLHDYDAMQYFNTMRYASLLNHHVYLVNPAEHELYFPHNMHMMSFATLDLMCSPDFDLRELGRIRAAAWHGQCMGRIGNLLSTWRRELARGDFTSDVFVKAVADGALTVNQLQCDNREAIDEVIRRGNYEDFFFGRWCDHRDQFRDIAKHVESTDLQMCLRGHERFFRMHLASRGLI